MAETYGPFASGGGSDFTETEWSHLLGAAIPDGVITHADVLISQNKLAVSADSSIMGVYVATGRGVVRGHLYQNDATLAVAVTAAHATLARIDRVILRLDRSARTVVAAVVAGTASGSPVAPALTRSNDIWEIPLARVTVAAAAGVIAAGAVSDDRLYAQSVTESPRAVGGSGDSCGTGIEDMPDMSITQTTDGGAVTVIFQGWVSAGTAGAATRLYVQIDGGSDVQVAEHVSNATNETGTVSVRYPVGTLAAGRHTCKIRYNASSGTATVSANRWMVVQEVR